MNVDNFDAFWGVRILQAPLAEGWRRLPAVAVGGGPWVLALVGSVAGLAWFGFDAETGSLQDDAFAFDDLVVQASGPWLGDFLEAVLEVSGEFLGVLVGAAELPAEAVPGDDARLHGV